MSEEVKVMFPDGRTTTLPRKTAESKDVKDIGGFIVEQVVKIPKHFAPIKVDVDVVMSAEDNAIVEGEQIITRSGFDATVRKKVNIIDPLTEAPKPARSAAPTKRSTNGY